MTPSHSSPSHRLTMEVLFSLVPAYSPLETDLPRSLRDAYFSRIIVPKSPVHPSQLSLGILYHSGSPAFVLTARNLALHDPSTYRVPMDYSYRSIESPEVLIVATYPMANCRKIGLFSATPPLRGGVFLTDGYTPHYHAHVTVYLSLTPLCEIFRPLKSLRF